MHTAQFDKAINVNGFGGHLFIVEQRPRMALPGNSEQKMCCVFKRYTLCAPMLLIVFCVVLSVRANASFLDMPDTTEVPDYEQRTMQLDLDVPGVRDRDPDPQGGPRLNVKEFRIQGLVDYPKLNIYREELIKRVEQIRFDLMQESELLDSGYTIDEISEMSDLVGQIEEETKGEHVGPLEVQKLVFLVREQRRKRGITLGMIETVADTITRYYRERGFILAKAYIPKQKVRDGIVNLTLLLGDLGEIEAQNNRRYSQRDLSKVFDDSLGEPITASIIEENLYLINDLPGLAVQGYFTPGSQVGDTKMNVNVLSESWFDANIRIDNHGSKKTGEQRAYIDMLVHNPTGTSDQLYFGLLSTYNPDNSLYGSFRYNTNVISPRLKLSAGISNNDFVTTVSAGGGDNSQAIDFTGVSRVADAFMRYNIKRSRKKNMYTDLSFTNIATSTESRGVRVNEDSSKNIRALLGFDYLDERARMLHIGSIGLTYSDYTPNKALAGNIPEDAQIQKTAGIINFDYSLLTFFNFPFTKTETRFVTRVEGQYAGSVLATVNEFDMSGATRVKAFDISTFYADDALFLGGEWLLKLPYGEKVNLGLDRLDRVLQPFIFVDGAYGVAHPKLAEVYSTTGVLADIGLGFKINYAGLLRGSITFATAIAGTLKSEAFAQSGTGSDTITLEKETQMRFDLLYNF